MWTAWALQRELEVNYKAQIILLSFQFLLFLCALWQYDKFSTDKNKHVRVCLNVLREL